MSLKTLVPILDAGSLEEDESMINKWAALLATAADPGSRIDVLPSFPEVLKELSPKEALALDTIYDDVITIPIPREEWPSRGAKGDFLKQTLGLSNEKFEVAIDNLYRLKVCSPPSVPLSSIIKFDTMPDRRFQLQMKAIVCLTEFGYAFVSACRPRSLGQEAKKDALAEEALHSTADSGASIVPSDEALRLSMGLVIEGQTPLSARRFGQTVTIEVSAFTGRFKDKTSPVHYNSGSISLLAQDTRYYVFAVDVDRAGGAVTYLATTELQHAIAGGDRIYIGSVKTPVK